MYLVLWVRHFLEAQGYDIKDNIVYQDNQSSMKLENNGKTSCTKNTTIIVALIVVHVVSFVILICPVTSLVASAASSSAIYTT